jgi:hypothetical protein
VYYDLSVQDLIFGLFLQMCASIVQPKPGALMRILLLPGHMPTLLLTTFGLIGQKQ